MHINVDEEEIGIKRGTLEIVVAQMMCLHQLASNQKLLVAWITLSSSDDGDG